MNENDDKTLWGRVPVIIRAVIVGIFVGMIAANVWPILLLTLGMPTAAVVEVTFLIVYVWWVAGGGPPARFKPQRAENFRIGPLSGAQCFWGAIAAVSFAVTIHASIVVLFRFVPFPAAAFHEGYDLSAIGSRPMQLLVCLVSALSAGVCEETGFRGYMQRPIEKRHGPLTAILISSLFFMLLHLTKDWALIGMVPIILLAGVLLGMLARASGTLIFCMLGHWIMDIGLFAFWWTQIAGTFMQRPMSEVGIDRAFFIECGVFAAALMLVLAATWRLARLRLLRTPSHARVA
jgi:membrane protease YdiL (CAAX protease family)